MAARTEPGDVLMNCCNCSHWSLRDSLRADMTRAKEGFGLCQKAEQPTFIMPGGYCSQWDQAEPKAIKARQEFFGGFL
jgi:hypothetical protein